MPKEPNTTPATKADLVELRNDLFEFIRQQAEQTRRHFEVVAENLHYDLKGAFSDRTIQHGDALKDHERRLRTVERRAGLSF